MGEIPRKRRLTTVCGVFIAGAVCAAVFCYLRPFDWYLLRSWESELATVSDQDVAVRLTQIAALGERSLPTLVSALHSERQIVAQSAAAVLQRMLDELELRSTDESSRIVAKLASELAARSERPGPHSGPASNRLATRFLLWPIDRASIDGERLVADCESIIRTAKLSPRALAAEQTDERIDTLVGFPSSRGELSPVEVLTPIAGGSLPVQLTDAPPLLPQTAGDLRESPTGSASEPLDFVPVQTPRALGTLPGLVADKAGEVATRQSAQPPVVDSRQSLDLRRDVPPVPKGEATRPDLRVLADLDVMRMLASKDESLTREAVDELYRRGFQTKHFRLAELLVDPDPNVRLQLLQGLPQMSGLDSRPWLLWLCRDEDPAVRKAAVAVIATSADPALLQRVRELEGEETDDEVLRVVRQVLNSGQRTTIR